MQGSEEHLALALDNPKIYASSFCARIPSANSRDPKYQLQIVAIKGITRSLRDSFPLHSTHRVWKKTNIARRKKRPLERTFCCAEKSVQIIWRWTGGRGEGRCRFWRFWLISSFFLAELHLTTDAKCTKIDAKMYAKWCQMVPNGAKCCQMYIYVV